MADEPENVDLRFIAAQRESIATADLTEAELALIEAAEIPAKHRYAFDLRHTLADLLAQCDPAAPLSDEDREWLDAPARGRELI